MLEPMFDPCWSRSCDSTEMLQHAVLHMPKRVACRLFADIVESMIPYCTDDALGAVIWTWDAMRRWVRGETDLEEVEAAQGAALGGSDAAMARAIDAVEDPQERAELHRALNALYAASWAPAVLHDEAAFCATYCAAHAAVASASTQRALARFIRQRAPRDPARHKYILWRDQIACAEMVRAQDLGAFAMILQNSVLQDSDEPINDLPPL